MTVLQCFSYSNLINLPVSQELSILAVMTEIEAKKVYKGLEINIYKLTNWYTCVEKNDAPRIFEILKSKHCHLKISS